MEKKATKGLSLGWAAAFTWFGGHCGSGFASGRQIVQYTTRHGIAGFWIPLAIWTILGWFFYWAVSYGTLVRARTYKEWAKSFYGKFLGPIMAVFLDFVTVVGGFIVLATMFAAAGQLFLEVFGLNFVVGALITAVVCGIIVVFGYKVYSLVNAFISIPMTIMLLIVQVTVVAYNWGNIQNVIATSGNNGTTFAEMIQSIIAYGGLQSGAYATFISLAYFGGKNWTKKDTIQACWGGAALNCFMHMFNVFMIYGGFPRVNDKALVTMSLLGELPPVIRTWLLPLYQIVLLLAIITTSVGSPYSIMVRFGHLGAKLVPNLRVRQAILGIGYPVLAVILSTVGLIALVSKGYSAIGNARTPSTVIPVSLLGIWRLNQMKKRADAGEDILMSPPVEEAFDV